MPARPLDARAARPAPAAEVGLHRTGSTSRRGAGERRGSSSISGTGGHGDLDSNDD